MKRKKVQNLLNNAKQKKETQANPHIEDSACILSSPEITESIELDVNSDDINSNIIENTSTIADNIQNKDKTKVSLIKTTGSSIKWILNYIMRILILIVNAFLGIIDGLQWIIISIVLTVAATFILRSLGISVDDIWELIKNTLSK